jgi:hypothetical protein
VLIFNILQVIAARETLTTVASKILRLKESRKESTCEVLIVPQNESSSSAANTSTSPTATAVNDKDDYEKLLEAAEKRKNSVNITTGKFTNAL